VIRSCCPSQSKGHAAWASGAPWHSLGEGERCRFNAVSMLKRLYMAVYFPPLLRAKGRASVARCCKARVGASAEVTLCKVVMHCLDLLWVWTRGAPFGQSSGSGGGCEPLRCI